MSVATEHPLPVSLVDANRVRSLPVLVLNVHSRCNCRCVMCDIWKRDTTEEIKAADLARHRESLRKLAVRWVVLSGGEPLMHSDLRGLCNFLRELRIRITLLTTGLLLERRSVDVAEFFDDVIISLDGPPEVHNTIRRIPEAFEMVANGVQRLRQERPDMPIMARTTVQKANHNRLNDTVDAALSIGLSGISFLAADLTSEAFNRPLLWQVEKQNSVALTQSEVSALDGEVARLISRRHHEIQSGYIAESPDKLWRIVEHFRAHLGLETPRSPECNAPWVSAVVESDGSVRPCFFHRTIGNISESSLDEIVNGESAVSFRRALNIAKNPICQRCVCSLKHSNGESA